MISWHVNVFHITGHLWGESSNACGFSHKGPVMKTFDFFLHCALEQAVEQTIELVVIRDAMALMWCHWYLPRILTWSSSCRNRCSCASSCRLWSSRICMRASRRPLCWRSSLASAIISESRESMSRSSGSIRPGATTCSLWACFKRSYSTCRFLCRNIDLMRHDEKMCYFKNKFSFQYSIFSWIIQYYVSDV